MNSILQQYYRGITQQLRAEVDLINSLFTHQGEKGRGNETVLRELIAKFIPKKYGVGTGIVIDRNGKQSRQCDIVIYDAFSYPSLLSLTSIHLFPVDLVYATIEVKTTLNSQSAKEAIQNFESISSLAYIEMDFGDAEIQGQDYVFGVRRTTPPFGVVFAYNSDTKFDQTFKKWFTPENERDKPKHPSLIGCLDMGLIRFLTVPPLPGTAIECATLPLAKLKDDGSGEFQFLKITGPAHLAESVEYEGAVYPIKKIGDDFMAIDQSKVLLHFILQLNDLLSKKRVFPAIDFANTYMKDIERFHFIL
jgi:hypothetical protein